MSTSVFHHPSLGAIRGLLTAASPSESTGRPFLQLLNLPYGRIPRRFARSELLERLTSGDGTSAAASPYDATRWPPASVQPEDAPRMDGQAIQIPMDSLDGYEEEQSEDCLRLSITLPDASDRTSSSPKLPVLVFMHGGAFFLGAGTRPYYSPLRLLEQIRDTSPPGIIFVALQYRLGACGFFHCPSAGGLVPPNNGLHDQRLALRWLQRHLPGFGGDVDNMTLLGQSAGAESIALHNLGPDLDTEAGDGGRCWARSIALSGSLVTMPSCMPQEHERNFRKNAEKLGIAVSGTETEGKGAAERNGANIAREMADVDVAHIRELGYVGAPCSSSEILPFERPTMALSRRRAPTSPKLQSQIVSSTSFDGGISYNMMINDASRKGHAKAFCSIALDVLSKDDAHELLDIYGMAAGDSGDAGVGKDKDAVALEKICQFESDIGFFAASLSLAEGAASSPRASAGAWQGQTFLCIFELGVPFLGPLSELPDRPQGHAVHTWDIVALLGAYEDRPELSGEAREIVRDWRQRVLNYVVSGQPPWPAWTSDDGLALVVGSQGCTVQRFEEYAGPGTRRGRLLALAERLGEDGRDVLWEQVCRRFLMEGK